MDFSNLAIETPSIVLEERVRKGAALLDDKAPGWAYHVDTGKLEGTCANHGVLGQVFGTDEVSEQCRAIGLPEGTGGRDGFASDDEFLEAGHAWAMSLVNLGFYAMVMEFREPPAMLRELAEFMGQPLPARVPVPRDDDQVSLECSTLVEHWRRAIDARR